MLICEGAGAAGGRAGRSLTVSRGGRQLVGFFGLILAVEYNCTKTFLLPASLTCQSSYFKWPM